MIKRFVGYLDTLLNHYISSLFLYIRHNAIHKYLE